MNSNRAADAMSGPSHWVNSRRTGRQAPRLRELDLNPLPYVPLPRAPMRWGTPSARGHSQMQEAEALFEIHNAPWQLASIEKLAAHERGGAIRYQPTRASAAALRYIFIRV